MNDFRQHFTKWYYHRGYRMAYIPCNYVGMSEMIFICPWWVRPLVEWFFSPCVYYSEAGYELSQGFEAGLHGWKQCEVLLGSDE